ncbi:MAG: MFS transporter [Dactylosporangium sp.]|nr:MFS transporter [Dactylosporangium sp.]
MSSLVIGVDVTVLNLALPTLATDLHATTAQLQWFADAYLLVLGALMLPAGMLGDRFGRRWLLLTGLGVFAVGSVACAYASSPGMLIAARAVLGLGAAVILPLSLSIIPVLFAEHERQRAIAVVASAAIAAYPIGPILGGWLLTHYWWGSVFLINIPLIAVAIVAVATLMPESRGTERRRLDPLGILLSAGGLAVLTYGIVEAGERGWSNPVTASYLAIGTVALAGFLAWQRRVLRVGVRQPLVELGLFRSPEFTWGMLLATLVGFAMIGLLFAVPQYLRSVLDHDAMATGIRLLPLVGGMIVGLGLGDRLSGAVGSKITSATGFALIAAGFAIASRTDASSGDGFLAGWLTVVGAGFGVALPSTMNAAIGRLTGERGGVGAALIAATRQIGGTFGVAVLGSLLNAAYRDHLPLAGLPAAVAGPVRDSVASGVATAATLGSPDLRTTVEAAFLHGMDVLLATAAGIAAAGAVLALVFLPSSAGSGPGREEADGALIHHPSGRHHDM